MAVELAWACCRGMVLGVVDGRIACWFANRRVSCVAVRLVERPAAIAIRPTLGHCAVFAASRPTCLKRDLGLPDALRIAGFTVESFAAAARRLANGERDGTVLAVTRLRPSGCR